MSPQCWGKNYLSFWAVRVFEKIHENPEYLGVCLNLALGSESVFFSSFQGLTEISFPAKTRPGKQWQTKWVLWFANIDLKSCSSSWMIDLISFCYWIYDIPSINHSKNKSTLWDLFHSKTLHLKNLPGWLGRAPTGKRASPNHFQGGELLDSRRIYEMVVLHSCHHLPVKKNTHTSSDCIFASVILASCRNQRIAMSLQNGETSVASILLEKSIHQLGFSQFIGEFPDKISPNLGGSGGIPYISYLTFLGQV